MGCSWNLSSRIIEVYVVGGMVYFKVFVFKLDICFQCLETVADHVWKPFKYCYQTALNVLLIDSE
jgi:hypothetical protein